MEKTGFQVFSALLWYDGKFIKKSTQFLAVTPGKALSFALQLLGTPPNLMSVLCFPLSPMDGYRVSFDIFFWGRRFWQELVHLGQRTDKFISSLRWDRLAGNLTPLRNKDTPESTVILNIYLIILPKVCNGNKLLKWSKIYTNPCEIT